MTRRAAALLVLCLGCSREESAPPVPLEGSVPDPILPTATALRDQPREKPAWIEALPAQEARAAKGDRVWASSPILPTGEMAEVGVYEVDGTHEGTYDLTDRLGQKLTGIPGALVHPVGSSKGLEEGDVVLFATQTTPGALGKVAELVPGAEIQVRYDFGGATRQAAVDHAEPPRAGTGPMAYVRFPKSRGKSRGLVLAESDDRLWIRTGSGHVEIHPRGEVEALPIPKADLSAGRRVRAFRWATGFQLGTVVEAIEPGLRYRVQLDGNRPAGEYFFTDLSPAT